jgi:hypothetical protein
MYFGKFDKLEVRSKERRYRGVEAVEVLDRQARAHFLQAVKVSGSGRSDRVQMGGDEA